MYFSLPLHSQPRLGFLLGRPEELLTLVPHPATRTLVSGRARKGERQRESERERETDVRPLRLITWYRDTSLIKERPPP